MEEEDQEMTQPTVVTKQIVMYGSGLTWIPEQKTVEGATWFKVSKWDRGLFRFVHGKGLDLRAKEDKQKLLRECCGRFFLKTQSLPGTSFIIQIIAKRRFI